MILAYAVRLKTDGEVIMSCDECDYKYKLTDVQEKLIERQDEYIDAMKYIRKLSNEKKNEKKDYEDLYNNHQELIRDRDRLLRELKNLEPILHNLKEAEINKTLIRVKNDYQMLVEAMEMEVRESRKLREANDKLAAEVIKYNREYKNDYKDFLETINDLQSKG